MKIAIVTGASSGIGREFARFIDENYELDELWVIARREERLNALARQLSHAVRVLPLDLVKPESMANLRLLLADEQPEVRLLVNAAGLCKFGYFTDLTEAEVSAMISLNCTAAVQLTGAAIPYMSSDSSIFQVCSAAAFQPLEGLNIYAASKSLLYNFSRALSRELAPRRIRVTAVAPLWVNTEFLKIAQDTKNGGTVKHFPFVANPRAVVEKAFLDNRRGLTVSTYGFALAHRILAKILPQSVIAACWGILRRI